MKHTKGKWDLSSKEFTERNTLGKLTLLELKDAEIGEAIHDMKKQYINESCKLKKGQKIRYIYYTNRWSYGIVASIRFDLHDGFTYYIDKYTKHWMKRYGHRTVMINHKDMSSNIFKDSIKIQQLINEIEK